MGVSDVDRLQHCHDRTRSGSGRSSAEYDNTKASLHACKAPLPSSTNFKCEWEVGRKSFHKNVVMPQWMRQSLI
jgi:hypothetical protein